MTDYPDNNLYDATRHEIEMHLMICEFCLDEIKDTQEVLNLFSNEEMSQPEESLRTGF